MNQPGDIDSLYAYKCIHRYFDTFGISDAVSYTESIIHAATQKKTWKKEVPAHVLFFIEKTGDLALAAFTLTNTYAQTKAAILTAQITPDVAELKNYVSRYRNSNAWSNFPRSLTAKQYYNPYKAIDKFCRCMTEAEWKIFFHELTEYALSKQMIDDMFPMCRILTIRKRLLQLIEAMHLIAIRTFKRNSNK